MGASGGWPRRLHLSALDKTLAGDIRSRRSPCYGDLSPTGKGGLCRVKADGPDRPRSVQVVLCSGDCGVMSSPVGECWRLAGETLRICSDQTAGPKRHLVDLAQPDHAPAGGQLIAGPDMIMPGLPSGRRVIAPREVEEVARTRSPPLPS